MSASDQRDKGRPLRCGNSHASALTATTTLGGKAGWGPATWFLFEAGEAKFIEAFAPFAHDLARHIQVRADELVGQTLRGHEYDLGPDHVTIR